MRCRIGDDSTRLESLSRVRFHVLAERLETGVGGPGLRALHEILRRLDLGPGLGVLTWELLSRAGETQAAHAAYTLAIERCANDAERALLSRRREALFPGRVPENGP